MIHTDFGGTIKRSRERLGLSQARVGELVGRSPSTVRSWEHGKSLPMDPKTITTLAALLAIDESDLFRAAGVEIPTPKSQMTIEQSLFEIGPANMPAPVIPESAPELKPRVPTAPRLPIALSTDVGTLGRHQRGGMAKVEPERLSVLPVPAVEEASYMEDPSQRLLYRTRTLLTGTGVVVMVVLLVWAFHGTVAAVDTMWNILTENL